MKTNKKIAIGFLFGVLILSNTLTFSQGRQRVGVISMDTKGISYTSDAISSLVHLELEKISQFEVLDKYDVSDILKANDIKNDACLGKTCQVRVGKLLNAEKMISGSVEKFGSKVIVVLRLIDVEKDVIEKTDVMEYINQLDDVQIMIQLSLRNLLGLTTDQRMKELLVHYAQPISSPKTTANLNGPRMGVSYVGGSIGKRLSAPKDVGGYNMHPIMTTFGYQHEIQYMSAGYFQALVEVLFMVNGLESGMFAPSITAMNGIRFNNIGLEFGVGPVIRASKTAKGYYDSEGVWNIASSIPEDEVNYKLEELIDSRGKLSYSTGMILAVGKTFTSGYLNMPVNFYYSPRKEGNVFGLSFGFNVAKTTRPVIKQ